MGNEKNNDRMTDIQDRMNSVDVAKRKRILVIFACICVLFLVLKLVVSVIMSGNGEKEEPKSEVKRESVTKSEEEQVLEFSLERKKKNDDLEDYLDKLVEEDRKKEKEKKDGETK